MNKQIYSIDSSYNLNDLLDYANIIYLPDGGDKNAKLGTSSFRA